MSMLKTLEKNSVGKALKDYWKQVGVLVIDLRSKWQDPFFKTEFNVVARQIGYAVVLLFLSYLFFSYLYEGILRTIVSSVVYSITQGEVMSNEELELSLEIIRAKN